MFSLSKSFFFLATLGTSLQAVAFPNGLALDLLAAFLFVLFYYAGHKPTLRQTDVWLLLWLLVTIIGGVSGFLSNGEFDTRRYLNHTSRLTVYFLFFMAVRDILISKPFMQPYAHKLILALGLFHGLYGLYQFIGFKYGLPLTDLRVLQAGKPAVRELHGILFQRVYGFSREPSNFGGFLIYWIFLSIAVGKLNHSLRRHANYTVPLLILACLLTISRGAIVAAFLAILIQLSVELFHGRLRRFFIGGGIFALLALIVFSFVPFIADYLFPVFTGEGDQSIVTRWSNYSIFLSNMDHWVIGHGLGQFELKNYVYEGIIWGPQSSYVYVISNSGLLGMVCYTMYLFCVLRESRRDDGATWFLRTTFLAGLIHNLFFLGVTTSLHWFVLAVVVVFSKRIIPTIPRNLPTNMALRE